MSSLGPEVAADLRQVTRLRNADSAKFRTLCHMHLSFLLDLDGASLEDILSEDGEAKGTKKSHNFPHFGRKKSKSDRSEMMPLHLDFECVENIEVLIRFLNRPENLAVEGLFRKSGQLSRQRVLRDKLVSGESLEAELESGVYTAHDCANLLKTFLGELTEPLLIEKHFSIYCKIPDMVTADTLLRDRALLQTRQMATAQLLVQLLRRENAVLLRALLALLHQVAHTPGNLMTSETLGTMFAPHLLVPRRMSANELQQLTSHTTRAVAFLIEHGLEIFKVPTALMRDITAYWEQMEEASDSRQGNVEDMDGTPCPHKYRKHLDPDALRTTVTFVDRQALQRAGTQTDTQVELAQLYAHINSMPESAKKRKLLKQFNRANGMGTPMAVGKHKRSKSLSESIKKMVGRSNHKRRGSGNAAPAAEAPSSAGSGIPPAGHQSAPSVIQTHTPIIRSGRATAADPTKAACSPSTMSPVIRLFKDAEHQPILPSNPCVHIVDLQTQAPLLLATCKRHLGSPPVFRTPRPLATTPAARRLTDNYENVAPLAAASPGGGRWTARGRGTPHAPVIVTPDRRATSCVLPITKLPAHMQTMLMTPGSRRPMSMLQTP